MSGLKSRGDFNALKPGSSKILEEGATKSKITNSLSNAAREMYVSDILNHI